MQYTVDFFINKFEAIPENKWCSGIFFGYTSFWGIIKKPNGQRCAQGHCMELVKLRRNSADIKSRSLEETEALRKIFSDALGFDKVHYTVALVNNGEDKRYQQPTPKQRILAALYDIRKLQEPKVK